MNRNHASTILLPNLEEPIRSELFSLERLEQHAESLAAAQLVTDVDVASRRNRVAKAGPAPSSNRSIRLLISATRCANDVRATHGTNDVQFDVN